MRDLNTCMKLWKKALTYKANVEGTRGYIGGCYQVNNWAVDRLLFRLYQPQSDHLGE